MYSDIYTAAGQLLEALLYMTLSYVIEWGAEMPSDAFLSNSSHQESPTREFAPVACHHKKESQLKITNLPWCPPPVPAWHFENLLYMYT